jgi:peptidoglycan pentaglycine glycine transferase (the first glycine)
LSTSLSIHEGFSDLPEDAWNRFLRECPQVHHEQTSYWIRVKSGYGWKPVLILIEQDGRIRGGVLLETRPFRQWGVIGFVERGPVAVGNDPDLVHALMQELAAYAKKKKMLYLVVLPPYAGEGHDDALKKMGFIRKPESLHPSSLVTVTSIIDLTENEEAIFKRMRASDRNNIRKSFRAGLVFREGHGNQIGIFRDLMLQLCRRRGVSATPPQKDFFDRLVEFYPKDVFKLFVVEWDQKIISAAVAFTFGETFCFWKTGWDGEYGKYHPNQFLVWGMIQWAKKAGFKKFDLYQILPEHAEAILKGETVHDHYWGVTSFKLGFGGQIKLFPPAYYDSFHPVVRLGLRFGGARLLANRKFLRNFNKFFKAW